MSQPTSPIGANERIPIIDALRGLAIFGILMVNLPLMYGPMSNVLVNPHLALTPADQLGEWIIKVFFEGKFYVLFSALFGFGFYIFLNKPSGSPEQNLKRFRRRLFYLLLFGIAHVHFLWAGDILVYYALFGFALIAFRNSTERRQIRWAIAFMLIPIVFGLLFYGMTWLGLNSAESLEETQAEIAANNEALNSLYQAAIEAYSQGSYTDTIRMRWREYSHLLWGILFFYPTVLAMFLFGYIAAKRGLISHFKAHLIFWRKALLWGWSLGLPLAILYAFAMQQVPSGDQSSGWNVIATAAHIVGGTVLSLGYVSWMVLRYANGHTHFFENYLAPVGRMALSNYIGHSFISIWLFHSFGLGLFGKIGAMEGIGIALLIFTAQIFISRWWLSHFRFGPLEWLWRCFTYGKLQDITRGEQEQTIKQHTESSA